MKAPLYVGLVHYPIYNKHGEVIATAITNYDLHDIARSTRTYSVEKYFIIHHIQAQKDLASEIMNHWRVGFGSTYNLDRKEAFRDVEILSSIMEAINEVESATGKRPYVITTDARTYPNTISYAEMRRKRVSDDRPILILFGTGYGMTKETMNMFDFILEPIYGAGKYNHLSVRSAVAIILDRLAGEAWWEK